MIAWFLSPYKLKSQLNRQVRYCQIFDLWDEIVLSGGYAHEAEIEGNLALVKVRASSKVIEDLGKIPGNVSVDNPLSYWTPTRHRQTLFDGQVVPTNVLLPNTNLSLIDNHVFNDSEQEVFKRLSGQSMELAERLGYYRLPKAMPNDLKYAILSEVANQGYNLGRISPGTFPTQPVFDNANRTNEGPPPSSSWETPAGVGGIKVSSNRFVVDGSSGYWVMRSTGTHGPDSEVYCDIITVDRSNNGAFQLKLRDDGGSPADDYTLGWYNATSPADVLTFSRTDNDVGTNLGSNISLNVNNGYSFGFEIIGNTLTGYYRTTTSGPFSSLGSRVDATYSASGRIGLAIYNCPGHEIDNVGRGEVIISGGPIQPTGVTSNQTFGSTSVVNPGTILEPTGLDNGQLLINWTSNTETDLAGYRIYYGYSAGVYSGVVDVGLTDTPGNPSYLLGSLKLQTTYIALTAYDNSNNESVFSSEFSGTPTGQVIRGITVTNSVEKISPTSVNPSEAFGQPTIVQPDGIVTVPGITSGQFINIPLLKLTTLITTTGLVSSEVFGSANVGGLTVRGLTVPVSYAFPEAIIIAGNVNVPVSSAISAEVFGDVEIDSSNLITLTGMSSGQAFGSVILLRESRIMVYPTISQESFGNLGFLKVGTISIGEITSSQSFGSTSLKLEMKFILPNGIISSQALGTPTLGAYSGTLLTMNPVLSSEVFGSASVLRGAINITPSGLITAQAFGTTLLQARNTLAIPGIVSSESVNSAVIVPGNKDILMYGIPTFGLVGTPILNKVIGPASIVSLQSFGNPSLTRLINPSGIITNELVNSVNVSAGPVVILVTSFYQGSTPGEGILITTIEEPSDPTQTLIADSRDYTFFS